MPQLCGSCIYGICSNTVVSEHFRYVLFVKIHKDFPLQMEKLNIHL